MPLRCRATCLGAILTVLIVTVTSTLTPSCAETQADVGGIAFDVSLGFADHFRPGTWVPIQMNVANEGIPLDAYVEVILTAGYPFTSRPGYVIHRRPLRLPSGTKKRVLINLPITDTYQPLDVRLVQSDGQVLATRRLSLRDTAVAADIVLVLDPTGERWTWLQEVARTPGYQPLRSRVSVIHMQTPVTLPSAWVAYESVRTIILTDAFPATSLSSEQLTAILDWVEAGGHLLVAGGPGLSVSKVPSLSNRLPVILEPSSRTLSLANLGETYEPLDKPTRVLAWQAKQGAGRVQLVQEDTVLVAYSYLGTGRITYLGFDPSTPSLRHWSDLDSFSRSLVFPPRMVRRTTNTLERKLRPLLATQQVPYPSRVGLVLFMLAYSGGLAAVLRSAQGSKVQALLLTAVVISGACYVQAVIAPRASRAMQAYGEIRLSVIAPGSGRAASFAVADMVRLRGGDWSLLPAPGVHLAPASNAIDRRESLLIVEQGDTQTRLGPLKPKETLGVTTQMLEELPIRVRTARSGQTLKVFVDNQSPWDLRSAFFVERERYTYIGDAPSGETVSVSMPDGRFVISSDRLSPDWIAAGVAAIARDRNSRSAPTELAGLRQIVAHALRPDGEYQDLPWGSPVIVALIDTPVEAPLDERFVGVGFHFAVIPLASIWEHY